MNVRQTPEVEKRIRQLWERFLLAGICNDLRIIYFLSILRRRLTGR